MTPDCLVEAPRGQAVHVVPTVAEVRRENIGSGPEFFGQVVNLVKHSLVVSREGRVEDMIPDLPAVQEKLVVAQAGHVNAGFRDFAVNLEVLPQVGGGVGLPGLTDSLILPAGAPV